MKISTHLRPTPGGIKLCSFPPVACPFVGWTRLNSIDKTGVWPDRRIGVHFCKKHAGLPFTKSSINPNVECTGGQVATHSFFMMCLSTFISQLDANRCRASSALRISCRFVGPPGPNAKSALFHRWRAQSPVGPPMSPPSRRRVPAGRHALPSTLQTIGVAWLASHS